MRPKARMKNKEEHHAAATNASRATTPLQTTNLKWKNGICEKVKQNLGKDETIFIGPCFHASGWSAAWPPTLNLTKRFVLLCRSSSFMKGQLHWQQREINGSPSCASRYQDLERLEKNTQHSHVVIALVGVLGSY